MQIKKSLNEIPRFSYLRTLLYFREINLTQSFFPSPRGMWYCSCRCFVSSLFSEVSAKQLEAEVEDLKKQNRQMRQDIKLLVDKLDQLAKEYESSKKAGPPKRYELLKEMIKTVVR